MACSIVSDDPDKCHAERKVNATMFKRAFASIESSPKHNFVADCAVLCKYNFSDQLHIDDAASRCELLFKVFLVSLMRNYSKATCKMMEIKYEGKDKCFKNNITLVEKPMTMCALKEFLMTICLHGLYPILKDNIQQDHPELHQFVQAATSNDTAIITKENQEKFKRFLENNNYG